MLVGVGGTRSRFQSSDSMSDESERSKEIHRSEGLNFWWSEELRGSFYMQRDAADAEMRSAKPSTWTEATLHQLSGYPIAILPETSVRSGICPLLAN